MRLVRAAVSVSALALAAVVLIPTTAEAVAERGDPTPLPSATESTPYSTSETDPLSGPLVRTVRYGKQPRQRMDVWQHEDSLDGVLRPAVFIIHGGWWNSGDKKSMRSIVRPYFDMGYTVFNLNYRLASDAPWPAQRTDVLRALATARRHGRLYGFDIDRYAIIGFSAGGHIATAVGTYGDGIPGLRAVVGVSPVVSPLTAYVDGDVGASPKQHHLRMAAVRLAGNCLPTSRRCAKVWRSMEVPWHASKHDAPVLTLHSEDEFVPPYQSELLKEQLSRVGVPMNIRVVPGDNHSTDMYRLPGVAEGVQKWVSAKLSAPDPRPTRTQRNQDQDGGGVRN